MYLPGELLARYTGSPEDTGVLSCQENLTGYTGVLPGEQDREDTGVSPCQENKTGRTQVYLPGELQGGHRCILSGEPDRIHRCILSGEPDREDTGVSPRRTSLGGHRCISQEN